MTYDESDNMVIMFTKLIKNGSNDDNFILERSSLEETRSVLFIHSCVPKIKEFVHNLRFHQEILTSPYIKTFEEMLSGLVFFTVETDSKDPFLCEGFPRIKHQKYIREIKIVDLLVDILIYPFEKEKEEDTPFCDLAELT